MDPADTFLSFADYAREQVGNRRACVEQAPALNHLEDIVWAFWAGEFQGGRFSDRIDGTAVHLRGNRIEQILDDDRSKDEERGYEVFDVEYIPVTRESVLKHLCSFEFLPWSMFPLERGQDPHPPFSDFIEMPLDCFLEDDNPAAPLGFEYLANKLSIGRQDLERWIAMRDRDKAKNTPESDCREWLVELMDDDSKPTKNKDGYLATAKKKFEVSGSAFERAWGNAIADTGNSNWNKPGPKRSPQRTHEDS